MLRYGNARDLCLGVEAVMADGSVVHGLGRLVKDNMGYDLRHLLIGAEGTLGLITAASLRLYPRPAEIATAWVAVASPAAALELLDGAARGARRRDLGLRADARPGPGLPGRGRCRRCRVPPAMPGDWVVLAEAADGGRRGRRRPARGGARGRRWRRASPRTR